MRKILAVTTTGLKKKDGIATVLLDYLSLFNRNEFEVHIAVSGEFSYDLIREFSKFGISIQMLPPREGNTISYFFKLIKLLKTQKYDSIYVNGSSSIMVIELFAAVISGCNQRVVHSHNTYCEHRILDKLFRPAFYLLYTSALACGKEAGKWLYGNRNFTVINNGRNLEKYQFNPAVRKMMRKQFRAGNSEVLIGHVGNFNKQKNQSFIVDISKKLTEMEINHKFILVGEGSNKKNVENKAIELKEDNNILFTGSVNNVPDILQAMDVMVLPSLYEGLPLVVVEWQISGLPSLISDSVTRECAFTDLAVFSPLSNGASKWADAIVHLYNDNYMNRIDLSDENKVLATKNGFDIRKNVEKLECIFQA